MILRFPVSLRIFYVIWVMISCKFKNILCYLIDIPFFNGKRNNQL